MRIRLSGKNSLCVNYTLRDKFTKPTEIINSLSQESGRTTSTYDYMLRALNSVPHSLDRQFTATGAQRGCLLEYESTQ